MPKEPIADVAIYAPGAGPLYVEGGGPTGGAELQTYYLARALVAAGLRVRKIILAYGQLNDEATDVELMRLPTEYKKRRLARRRAMLAALKTANARVYVQRSAGFDTGLVAAWARMARRQFVFSSSSEADFKLDERTTLETGAGMHLRRSRALYRLGLRLASAVVVQTERQRALASAVFGIDARVVPSFAETAPNRRAEKVAFLWVGGLVPIKDPLSYLELARRVPEAQFWLLGTDRPTGRPLSARVLEEAGTLPNLELLAPRSRAEVLGLYDQAVALVNTSRLEGFPNTFLEAWGRGTPVLSLNVDPDDVISANRLGIAAGGSMDRLAEGARELWGARSESDPTGTQSYIRAVHDPEVVGPQWAALIREIT